RIRYASKDPLHMSTAKTSPRKKSKTTPSIVWFEIAANDVDRAKKFYTALFGWKIKLFPGRTDYWHIDTGGGNDTPDGGLMARKYPEQPVTNYVAVSSVEKSAAKVEKLGGKICLSKTAVPGRGYFIICEDTEGTS